MATRSLGILGSAALLLVSCGAPPSAPPSSPAAPTTASAPEPQEDKHASPPAAESKPEPSSPKMEMPNVDFEARDDTVEAWFASQGIKDTSSKSLQDLAGLPASMDFDCDSVVPVGKPFEKAALCRRQFVEGQWELATSHLLLVPEAGKLRVIWQAPSAAGLLSETDTSEKRFVQLNVSLRDDGLVLFLDDDADYPCSDVRGRFEAAKRDAEPDEKRSLAALERMAASVCRGRGMYAWRGQSFVRTGPVPASARE